jgi:hypothetical protein
MQIENIGIVIVFLLNRNITEITASCGKIICQPVKAFSELLINGLKINAEIGIRSHKSLSCVFLTSKYVKNKTPAYTGH